MIPIAGIKIVNFIFLPVRPVYHKPKLNLIQLLQMTHLLSENTINGFLIIFNMHDGMEEYFINEFYSGRLTAEAMP